MVIGEIGAGVTSCAGSCHQVLAHAYGGGAQESRAGEWLSVAGRVHAVVMLPVIDSTQYTFGISRFVC